MNTYNRANELLCAADIENLVSVEKVLMWCVYCGLGWYADNDLDECPVCDVQKQLTKATNKTRKHVQALEIYADQETWDYDDWGIKSVNILEYGCPGKIANEALTVD